MNIILSLYFSKCSVYNYINVYIRNLRISNYASLKPCNLTRQNNNPYYSWSTNIFRTSPAHNTGPILVYKIGTYDKHLW